MSYVIAGLGDIDPKTQLSTAEDRLAVAIKPLHPVIDKLEAPAYLGNAWKNRLKAKPITALLELFRPFENVAAEIIVEANRISGKTVRRIGSTDVDMRVDRPENASLDLTTRDLDRRLRIVTGYMTLIHQDPKTLATAGATVLAKYGVTAATLVQAGAQQLQQTAQQGADKLRQLFSGFGAVPAIIAGAVQKMVEAKATLTTIAITSAPIVVPAVVSLILGLTKQASADVKQQQQTAAQQKAQMQAMKDDEGFPILPLLGVAIVGYFAWKR